MADVGRPSVLDDELKLKIREMVHAEMTNENIAAEIGVPIQTFTHWLWRNYQGLADCMTTYRHERMLKKAEVVIEALQSSGDDKVRLDASKFTAETLGKRWFSKRTEQTGRDGGPIEHSLPADELARLKAVFSKD